MQTFLLVSNVTTEDKVGRAADFATRENLFSEYGWEQVIGQVPQPYFRTFLPSLVRCYRRGRRKDVDIVVSVSNPFHLQIVGFLVSLMLGVPWVVEFRDPMVENPDRDPGAIITKLAKFVEWLCVTRAERVLWTDGIQVGESYYRETYPNVDPETFVELPFKGYDRANFENSGEQDYETFTITYAGSFYEGWLEPYSVLDGIEAYVNDKSDDLTVQFYGDWDEDYTKVADGLGVSTVVETYEFVPHEEIVPVLKGSDALLYIGGTDSENSESVPSKLWDYIGAKNPILAVVDPSFRVAELIKDNNLGIVVDPRKPSEISAAIDQLRLGSFTYDPDPSVFEKFERETKISAMAEILEAAVEG